MKQGFSTLSDQEKLELATEYAMLGVPLPEELRCFLIENRLHELVTHLEENSP